MGLYKKLLLADPASHFAIAVYGAADASQAVSWFDAWLGTMAFALQIYFDFSGYSDMAIGLARMFGMKFPCNFDSPYRAGSVIDFWRRWHMTLTRFLREYVYFSLGGNRCGPVRRRYNIMVTMLLSGLWHGAGWTFVIWGGLHGFFLLVNNLWREFVRARRWQLQHWTYRAGCVLLTFTVVLLAWVFFRASNLPAAGKVLASMTGLNGVTIPAEFQGSSREAAKIIKWLDLKVVTDTVGLTSADYRLALKLMVVLLLVTWFMPNTQQLLSAYEPTLETVERAPPFRVRINGLTGLASGIIFFFCIRGYFTLPQSPFLYFNF
jgi:alginate O-acetyltransferase complex protein AlgI